MSDELGPFIFWDGEETKDAGYCLFGCSVGGNVPDASTTLQSPHLHSADLLDLLLDVANQEKRASHVAFSFDYDVNWIIQDLDWKSLIQLNSTGKVKWNGYTLSHIPHKMFSVSHPDKGSIRVDDIFSFFRCRYDKALDEHHIGDPDIIREISGGKDKRTDFWWADIDFIRHYWALECEYGCLLMDKTRRLCHNAGYYVNKWYGPGALAAYSLSQHKITSIMAQPISGVSSVPSDQATTPGRVRTAALFAYGGGWFERFKMGMLIDFPIYSYDINSAYVYAMSLLPPLAGKRWVHYSATEVDLNRLAKECRFGLFHTKWKPDSDLYLRSCYGMPIPLFHRDHNGRMVRPALPTETWLWNPEAANASVFPHATFTEAWILEGAENEYPFAWVEGDYNKRLALKKAGDATQFGLKSALASYYGRLAQRTGWNQVENTSPQFHQIEWAGWITSKCRSMIYRVAFESSRKDGLISADTDGIISTVPVTVPTGDRLGQWKEDIYDGVVYLQNGVYWLRKKGEWQPPKLRGIPKTKVDYQSAMAALDNGGVLELSRRTFVGYGAALHRGRELWRTWQDVPVRINAASAGGRVHVRELCRRCRKGHGSLSDGLHDLILVPQGDTASTAHELPWLKDPHGRKAAQRLREHLLAEDAL
jgi:hypothetical protein